MSDPPMRDGWITVDRGRVAAVTKRAPSNSGQQIDLGEVAVLPGLVNAHTHLELSYLRHEVPPASEFVTSQRRSWAVRPHDGTSRSVSMRARRCGFLPAGRGR